MSLGEAGFARLPFFMSKIMAFRFAEGRTRTGAAAHVKPNALHAFDCRNTNQIKALCQHRTRSPNQQESFTLFI
jgi:hypothetical protein